MNFKGNRWYKCDLHIHTIESKCFQDKGVTAEEWVQDCLDKKLDVVAITDHNSGNYIDDVIQAAKGTDLTVFPGVEITCDTSKVHLLIIFDKNKRSKDINEFLNYCGISSGDFAEQNATTDEDYTLFKVAERANKVGALVIPAHIDEYNGISSTSYQTMSDFLDKPFINGVQVVNKEFYNYGSYSKEERTKNLIEHYPEINEEHIKDWNNAVDLAKNKNKAILTFSDNPHAPGETKHGLWGIGSRYTWIKMDEEITLESLRHALVMPNQKIRNDFDYPDHPYAKPDLLIKGLEIQKTILNPDKPIKIQFSSQLNSIIGGRGTGKSSISRIIRGLLNQESDLSDFDELLREQKEFFTKASGQSGFESGIITEDTKIELYIERYNKLYKIVYFDYKNGDFDKKTFEVNESDECIESDSILDLINVDIFSQKQIYNIATQPNALREKIDQSIVGLSENSSEIEKNQEKYYSILSKMRSLQREISRKSQINSEIKDLNNRIQDVEVQGYQKVLDDHKIMLKDKFEIDEVFLNIEKNEQLIIDFTSNLKFKNLDEITFKSSSKEDLIILLKDGQENFAPVIDKLKEASDLISTLKEKLREDINKSNWIEFCSATISKYKSLKDKLSSKELEDLLNIEDLTVQLDEKNKLIEDIVKYETELKLLQEDLDIVVLPAHITLRENKTNSRKEFLKEILSETENIKIDVKPYRDTKNYVTELRKILQRTDNFSEEFETINNFISSGSSKDKVLELRSKIKSVKETENEDPLFKGRFKTVIKNLNEQQIDMINLLYPEDEIEVKYKANAMSPFKSISNASAGQKTSAILTFLLSYGTSPLILDQPEDDLDNQLIYDLIVNRLSESKNTRQIIVVTHNANIPVNGDSEWVIAMNSESKDVEILYEGSIEDEKVKDEICNIMEGGKEAFDLRAKRYNI